MIDWMDCLDDHGVIGLVGVGGVGRVWGVWRVVGVMVWEPVVDPMVVVFGVLLLVGLICWSYLLGQGVRRDRRVLAVVLCVWRILIVVGMGGLLLGPGVMRSEREVVREPLAMMVDTSASMAVGDGGGVGVGEGGGGAEGGVGGDQGIGGLSRLDGVLRDWLSPNAMASIGECYDVSVFRFGDGMNQVGVDDLKRISDDAMFDVQTDLVDSVRDMLRSRKNVDDDVDGEVGRGALLVLSDGRDTAYGRDRVHGLLGGGVDIPVHTVVLGGGSDDPDLVLTAMLGQSYLMVDEPGELLVRVYRVGVTGGGGGGVGGGAMVVVRTDGDETRWPVVFDSNDDVGGDDGAWIDGVNTDSVLLRVPVLRDRSGEYRYEVEVLPAVGEINLGNNKQVVYCRVSDRRLRVLLVEGQPYWDTKFLGRVLRGDDRVSLVQLSRLSGTRVSRVVTRVGDAEVDVVEGGRVEHASDWSRFDVVIFGRKVASLVSDEAWRGLSRAVSDDGLDVIFSRGDAVGGGIGGGDGGWVGDERVGVWDVLQPVVWGDGVWLDDGADTDTDMDVGIVVTDAGRESRVFGDGTDDWLFPLSRLYETRSVKPGARVLAEARLGDGDVVPVVVVMQYGRGRVLAMAGEGWWRGGMGGHVGLVRGQVNQLANGFDGFWMRMLRWMVLDEIDEAGDRVSLSVDRSYVSVGESVVFDVIARGGDVGVGGDGGVGVWGVWGVWGGWGDIGLRLELRLPSGGVERLGLVGIGLGHWRGVYQPSKSGEYRATLYGGDGDGNAGNRLARVMFSVHDMNIETIDRSANPGLMRRMAAETGGLFFEGGRASDFVERLAYRRAAREVVIGVESIWDRWEILVVLMVMMGVEWFIRRGYGWR